MPESATTSSCGDAGRLSGSLRTLFGVGTLSGLTDGQLLEGFLRGRGGAGEAVAEAEAAFTALVERHGPMVLGVCRAILGDRHDAEDACQAAFLVLARRAGTIRRGDAVASWLYGAARRIAARARRDLSRRRELERRRLERIGPSEPVATSPADPWPELYEELDGLPEPFRAAVVLCDLEGHSYEQAAGLLGCPVGTLQSRLARGRERLRRRLERRGIAPAIIGIGSGVNPMSALSPQLTAAIARAAVDSVGSGTIAAAAPVAVAALVGAEIRRQIMSRVALTSTVLAMAGFVVTAAIVLAAGGRGDDPVPRPPVAAKVPDAEPIHVRVVDLDGNGAAGIAVEVRSWNRRPRSFATDLDGRAAIPRDAIGEWSFLVARRGNAWLAWCPPADVDTRPNRPAGTEGAPIVMSLLPVDRRVEGSVVDRAGGPIAGVEMRVDSLEQPTNGSLYLNETILEPLLPSPTTDRAGRFAMILPRGASVGLRALHPRFIGHRIRAAGDAGVLPAATLLPAGGITGRVTDAATGEPVVGAVVFAQLIEDHDRVLGGSGDARSDDRGRFALLGLEPGVYNLILSQAPGRPGATARALEGVRVRAGADTPADMAIIEGRPLRGMVIDRDTGQPVPRILVGCYGQTHPPSGAAVESTRADDQGRFTFHVPPGEHSVYLMEWGGNSRLDHRTVVVPGRGEIEPIQLMRRIQRVPAAVRAPAAPAEPAAAPPAELAAAGAEVSKKPSEVVAGEVEAVAKPSAPEVRTITRTIFGDGDGDGPVKPPDPNTRTAIGLVRDLQGRPVPGIHVGITGTGDPAATDRDGIFELANVPRGELRIHLHRRHGKFQYETIAAGRDRVEITLQPEIASPARERLVPPTDEPIPPEIRSRLTFVDLDPEGTDFVIDGPGEDRNDLSRLPRGIHRLGATFFRIGEKMVHLRGRLRPDLPRSVKGINVRARGHVIHFLHGTQYGADSGPLIGIYVVHYADGSSESIPLIYGRNLANWWRFPRSNEEPTEAKVAWTGTNDATDLNPGLMVRLFDMAWTNPHPEKEIASLDVLSAGKECDPFLVAVTVERDGSPRP